MKWLDVFNMLLPVLGLLVPKAQPFLPSIAQGVNEAAMIPGASDADKRAHLLNVVAAGATAATATGKAPVDVAVAQSIASNVLKVVDGVKAVHVAAAQG